MLSLADLVPVLVLLGCLLLLAKPFGTLMARVYMGGMTDDGTNDAPALALADVAVFH